MCQRLSTGIRYAVLLGAAMAIALSSAFTAAADPMTSDAPAAQEWATVTGTVRVDEFITKPPAQAVKYKARDGSIQRHEYESQELLIDKQSLGLANVVVWLVPPENGEVPIHPSYKEVQPVELTIENGIWKPHVLLVRTTQPVTARSRDNVLHNESYLLFTAIQPIGVAFVPTPGKSYPRTFHRAEATPRIIACTAHPWERLVVFVQDHPYTAITDEKGRFEIKNVPTGEWTFKFWHESTGWLKSDDYTESIQLEERGELPLDIKGDSADMGTVVVPKGFIAERLKRPGGKE